MNAALRSVVPGRRLDDDCNALLRLDNGASGVLMASQVAAGERNGLRLRVYGENGSIDWHQEDPNRLRVKWQDGPEEIRHAAAGYLGADARAVTRLPGGHPEGYIEAFAVLYREFADGLIAWRAGKANPLPATLPGIVAGVRGMRFIERAIESNRMEAGWSFRSLAFGGRMTMKTIKGPGIFLAQFAGDEAPFNTLEGMAQWAAGLGFTGVQIPSWDGRLFDLKLAAESQGYCDEVLGVVSRAGLAVTELSTHLQGQLGGEHIQLMTLCLRDLRRQSWRET